MAHLTICFSCAEIELMRNIIKKNERRPIQGSQGDRDHVIHCLHQLIRFSVQASLGSLTAERQAQFFLNLGRAQEILGSCGGAEAWWRRFYPLVAANEWGTVIAIVKAYLELLGLPLPSAEFIAKI